MRVSTCLPQFLKLYADMLLFAGHNVITKTHSHHALGLVMAFDSNAIVNVNNYTYEARGLLLKQDIEHSIRAEGFMIFVCISPESTLGKRLNFVLRNENVLVVKPPVIGQIKNYISELIAHDHAEPEIMSFFTSVMIEDIALVEKNYTPDLRIENVVRHILSNLNKSLQFKELVGIACLSESRLSHLFKKEIGIPIRKYILWHRLQHGIRHFLQGHTLTQAAHLAGFSDVSHFTRTFVSNFGMSPSQILRNLN